MTSFKKPIMAKVFCPFRLICLISFLCFAEASIEIFDPYGKKVDSFMDREAFDDDFFTLEGYLSAAEPSDACTAVEPPTYLTNFTMSKFLLVNGSDACIFTTKVSNAEKAGYDVVIMYDSSPTPYQYVRYAAPIPRIAFDIQLVFVSYFDGMIMKNNYLFNSSFPHNYRIKLKPNTPDITYYMYLFGAVIGVCFFVMLLFMTCLLIKCIQERRRLRRNRLSSRQIKQIPTAKFAKGDQYDVCAICLENYNEGDKLRILPCSHAYHTKCIDPWLMNNRRNCPLCKRKIRFGDSGDESDSEDSELTSPTENTPLLRANGPSDAAVSPLYYSSLNPRHNVEASRLSHLYQNGENPFAASGASSENPFASEDDSESLLPPARSSVNGRSTADVSTSGPPDLRWCHLMPRHGMESDWPRETPSENPANGRSTAAAAASTSGVQDLSWRHLIPRHNVEARLKRDTDALSENPFASEEESLLPPARGSANGRSAAATSTADDQRVVVVNFGATQDPEVETDQRGLIV